MKRIMLIVAMLPMVGLGVSMNALASPETIEVEVVFTDHWGKESEPVRAVLPLHATGEAQIVTVSNSKSPLPDLLKLAVVHPDSGDGIALLAEEKASRIVGYETRGSENEQSRVQLPKVMDMHAFEPHSLGVGQEFSVASGGEVLSVVRRIR